MVLKNQPRVFVSYSRRDGKDFAAQLRHELLAREIAVWQDLIAMEGGRNWWFQITQALDQVEYMLLIATPAAMESKIVRKEWRYARQQGVCVYPVMMPGLHPDFSAMPRWMRESHFYDYSTPEQHEKLFNDILSRCEVPRVPFMVEDLPDDFVQRPHEFSALRDQLLDLNNSEPIAITAALRGAGGYGKTTLARALCHDEDVQEAFDDGILWVTLGEDPGDLTTRLLDLITVLGIERPDVAGIEAARSLFKQLLADRDMLIVIDDVWHTEHLEPFLDGGPRCARLVTTRNDATLPPAARRIDVDAMRVDEALALLQAGLQIDDPALNVTLTDLADKLGHWPLLLKLVNGVIHERLSRHQTVAEAIRYVERALNKRGLRAFDARDTTERTRAVSLTLSVSFDQLSSDEFARYTELAIFPEDLDIPFSVVGRLWAARGALDDLDSEELLVRLHKLSLLIDLDFGRQTLRLHDIFRAYLRDDQRPHLATLNQALLGTYDVQRWADLPDDEPYLWDFLVYHLIEGDQHPTLDETLRDLRYLTRKIHLRSPAAAESDLLQAMRGGGDGQLRLLWRAIARASHLLGRSRSAPDVGSTLYSRMHHLIGKGVEVKLDLPRPYLAARFQLPDLPDSTLLRMLEGHTNIVTACDTTAALVVTASRDRTLRVWNRETGDFIRELTGHTNWVNACAFSPDGRLIASGADDGTLRVWEAASGAPLHVLSGHTAGVTAVDWLPDSKHVISASRDKTLRLWDISTGEVLHTYEGHTDWVNACAVNPGGRRFISASDDGTLRLWEVQTGATIHTLTAQAPFIDCTYSPDGLTVVASLENGQMVRWELEGEAKSTIVTEHYIGALAFSPDGETVVAGARDGVLKLLAADLHGAVRNLRGHRYRINDCLFTADGTTVISASDDWTCRVWDTDAQETTSVDPDHRVSGSYCYYAPDGRTIVTLPRRSGTVALWDAATCKITTWHKDVDAMSLDGQIVVQDRYKPALSRHGASPQPLEGDHAFEHGRFSPDANWFAGVARELTMGVYVPRDIVIWETATGRQYHRIEHTHGIEVLTFSPDSRLVAGADREHRILVWRVDSGALLHTLESHRDYINSVRFSRDDQLIVSAGDDHVVRIWDATSGHLRHELTDRVRALGAALNPDNHYCVVAYADNRLVLWDVKAGLPLTTVHTDETIYDCDWHPTQDEIVAVGRVGTYFFKVVW